MNAFHQKLAEVLQFHRKKAGLNRVELAKLAGVGKTQVFDLEHGKPSVQLDTLLKLLKALNIQIKLESPLMQMFGKGNDAKS